MWGARERRDPSLPLFINIITHTHTHTHTRKCFALVVVRVVSPPCVYPNHRPRLPHLLCGGRVLRALAAACVRAGGARAHGRRRCVCYPCGDPRRGGGRAGSDGAAHIAGRSLVLRGGGPLGPPAAAAATPLKRPAVDYACGGRGPWGCARMLLYGHGHGHGFEFGIPRAGAGAGRGSTRTSTSASNVLLPTVSSLIMRADSVGLRGSSPRRSWGPT